MDGTKLSDDVVAAVRSEIEADGSPSVCLATVLVGDDRPSQTYVRMKHRRAERAGMQSLNVTLPATTTHAQVDAAVAELAADAAVHGILVQLPLPPGLDADAVIQLVPMAPARSATAMRSSSDNGRPAPRLRHASMRKRRASSREGLNIAPPSR